MRKEWVRELIDDRLRNDWFNLDHSYGNRNKLPSKFIVDLDYNDISVTKYTIDTIRTDDDGKYYMTFEWNGLNVDCKNARYYLLDGPAPYMHPFSDAYKPMPEIYQEIKPTNCMMVARSGKERLPWITILNYAAEIFNWDIEWTKHQFTKQPYLDIKMTFLKNYATYKHDSLIGRDISRGLRGNTISYSGITNYLLKKRSQLTPVCYGTRFWDYQIE